MISRATSTLCGFVASGTPRWRWRRLRLAVAGSGRWLPISAPCPGSTREFFFDPDSREGHEQMSQGHQAHVVVPARPRPRFVLGHAQITLALLEILLDAVAR